VLGWEASWCDLSERALGIGWSVGGGGGGSFYYDVCDFSRASKILFGDMEFSSFRWLFLQNSA